MGAIWPKCLVRFGLLLAAAVFLGWFYGYPAWWLLGATLGYLGWHLFALFRFNRWLRGGAKKKVPELPELWADMAFEVLQFRRRNKERKKQLRRVLREFRKSTAALPDGAVVLGPEREIRWFNSAAASMLGLRRTTDRGQRVEHFVRQPEFVQYLRHGDFSAPIVLSAPTSQERSFAYQVVPYGDQQQLLLIKDATLQVKLERVRQDFVANASHELRSPLTVVNGYLDAMAGDQDVQEAWGDPIGEMRRQVSRMTAIISDLLQLSRLDAEGVEAECNFVDVAGMAALIRKEALSQGRGPRQITLAVGEGKGLLGNEQEIHSAFSNLVDNAVKYTPEDGRVEIGWTVDDTGGHFSVTDSGVGIDAVDVPRITERFYRVDKGRSREQGGTGLGLAIVKHVLQRHGARLEVRSEPGSGSTFTCHFTPDRIASNGA